MKKCSILLFLALMLALVSPTRSQKPEPKKADAAAVVSKPTPTIVKDVVPGTASKYGNLIIKEDKLVKKGHFVDSIFSNFDNLGIDLHVNYHCMIKPLFMVKEPHAHPCYEVLCFIGGNPLNIRDFGGEVDLTMGDEKHTINSTSFVVIPPGLPHCPLNFRKVDKPFMFMVILTMGKYATLPQEQLGVKVDPNAPPPPPPK
jgi:mannose-6-phosphate isomerase-like protein (cupin superfamily)